MQIDLSDKLAIVSGSTAGIGFAIASGLAAAGATVVVNGRSQAAVDRAIAAIRNGQPDARVRGVAGDLGTAEGCAAFVAAEPKADILVNNLGIFELKDFFDIEDAEWSRFFEVNVMSGVRLARAYVPGMVERGWGRVVFLSSESALNIPADMIHYGFSKTANLSVSRGLAKRLAGTGVTVNA
ncbi:SDR family oxidoreductase, partial [Pseudomonas aeruginosa]